MFDEHEKYLKNLLESDKKLDWLKILEKHRIMLLRIQHERLIHLLVTIFVGISLVICVYATIDTKNLLLLLIDMVLILLFIAYIFHYHFLENTTQAWYTLEDKILEKLNK